MATTTVMFVVMVLAGPAFVGGKGKDTASAPNTPSDGWLNAGLKQHNKYRELHQAPALVLDKVVTKFAQNFANKLATSNDSASVDSDGMRCCAFAENLFYTDDANFTAASVVDSWYSSGSDYDFNSTDVNEMTDDEFASFVIVVWKNATKLGMGVATSEEGLTFVVAEYWFMDDLSHLPGNNITDIYRKNVLPAKKKT